LFPPPPLFPKKSGLGNKFRKRSSIHKCQTPIQDSLQIPLFKTAAGQRLFAYRAVHIWNNLDKNLDDDASLKLFKTALKKIFLKKQGERLITY
jgi:hypothetical protein